MNWIKEISELNTNDFDRLLHSLKELENAHTSTDNCIVCNAALHLENMMLETKWLIEKCNIFLQEGIKLRQNPYYIVYEINLLGLMCGFYLGRQYSEVKELEKML